MHYPSPQPTPTLAVRHRYEVAIWKILKRWTLKETSKNYSVMHICWHYLVSLLTLEPSNLDWWYTMERTSGQPDSSKFVSIYLFAKHRQEYISVFSCSDTFSRSSFLHLLFGVPKILYFLTQYFVEWCKPFIARKENSSAGWRRHQIRSLH
jgi:hypothetical protein